MKILLLAAVFAVAAFQAAAEEGDIPAKPKKRVEPAYPVACEPAPDEAAKKETVVVVYNVNRDGYPEDVRAQESSNPCFEDVAVAAIRASEYEPRRVDGRREAQEDFETTFIFEFDQETQSEDYDARPLKRVPPMYPVSCMESRGRRSGPESRESVLVVFDVTMEGDTENIKVKDSTYSCLNSSAVSAVRKWKYHPKTVGGEPVGRKGVETLITFILGPGGLDDDMIIRRAVANKLNRVGRMNRNGEDPQKALEMLEEIEAEYGPSFSRAESAAFHQIRGFARITAGDYRGALDDLRIAKATGGLPQDTAEAVSNAIEILEAEIAQQE